METQNSGKGRFKVGDVLKTTRELFYFRIIDDSHFMRYTASYPSAKVPYAMDLLLRGYRRGTLLKVKEEDLLIAILTGKVKS